MKQMTQIEQQQAQLRQIHTKNGMDGSLGAEVLAASGEAHHTIGISQNLLKSIPQFLQKNSSDPAIKVGYFQSI